MTLLFVYVLLALGVSFLCSIFEAVLLSVSPGYIELLEEEAPSTQARLKHLKANIDRPLSAILTLNTIAHTVGAAGAGAQAAQVFGSAYIGLFSAVLTLLILVLSEIIPKTLGAYYWRALAPATALALVFMVKALYPFVLMADLITRKIAPDVPQPTGFDRREFSAMAELSFREGQIDPRESNILKNLMNFHARPIREAMTPRTVLFAAEEATSVKAFFERHEQIPFSRIPVYREDAEKINGIVLLNDLLLAQARGEGEKKLGEFRREIPALLDAMSLDHALEEFLRAHTHMMLVVTEYGSVVGIITLEDVLETLLGQDIIDEKDKTHNMQKLARKRWRRQVRHKGLDRQS